MTQDQFLEWVEYYSIEPFGEERADIRAGSIAAATYNVHRRTGMKAFSPADCAIKIRQPVRKPKPRTAKQLQSEFNQFKEMMKATALA